MSDDVDLGEDKAELDGVGIREGKDANEVAGEGIDMTVQEGWQNN